MNINTGATLTGGATTVLSPAGFTPGRSTFVGPGHTRLTPEVVTFTTSASPPGKTAGEGRTGLRIQLAGPKEAEEGCCSTTNLKADLNMLVQTSVDADETYADRLIVLIRALVYTSQFEAAIKDGFPPGA